MSYSPSAAGIGGQAAVAAAGTGVLLKASLGLREPDSDGGRISSSSSVLSSVIAPVSAWLIPGGDASFWISELILWAEQYRADLASLALYLLPRSPRDLRPGALLAVLPGACAGTALAAGASYQGRMQPYTCVAGRLFMPRDAVLFPHVTREELLRLCHYPVLVLHPGIGAVGFENESRLSLDQMLLAPAGALSDRWDFARPGLELHGRLIYVEMRMPASLAELFGGAQGEIGSDPIKLPELPPPRTQPPGKSAGTGAGAGTGQGDSQGILGKQLQNYLNWMPGIAAPVLAGASWVDKATSWLSQGMKQHETQQLQDKRQQELNRLLRLLENDPEQGLRHALPLSSSADRGIGTRGTVQNPGATLGNKDPRFSLRAFGGGYAVEGWDINAEIQAKLRQRYIQLALQEANLGRHQRAAYIYAELLGDLSSAASVLKQGGFYREAAVLYRDHLNRQLEAAECLALAGQINEAIVIYEKLDRVLDCARLCRQIGREEDAARYFRRSVEAHIRSGNLLTAATELEDNLQDHDEALKVLASAWPEDPRSPKSSQAAGCVTRYFQKCGTMGRHQDANRMLLRLKAAPDDSRLQVPYLLLRVHGEYPDAAVVESAGDIARVKIGRLLPARGATRSQGEVGDLLRLLQQLDTKDRLLTRDTGRFMALRNEAERQGNRTAPPSRKPASPGMSGEIKRISLSPLGDTPHIQWRQIVGNNNFFCAWGVPRSDKIRPGIDGHGIWFIRRSPDGSQQAFWSGDEIRKSCQTDSPNLELEMASRPSMPVLLWVSGPLQGTLPMRPLPASDAFPHATEVGQPSWFPSEVRAVAYDANMMLWQLRRVQDCHYISGNNFAGHRFSNAEAPPTLEQFLSTYPGPVSMKCLDDQLIIALGTRVLAIGPSQTIGFSEDLSEGKADNLLSLAVAPRHTVPRFACTDKDRVTLVTMKPKHGSIEKMETIDLPEAQACFTTDGTLVVVSDGECKVLESTLAGLVVRATMNLQQKESGVVGIIPGFNPGEFIVLENSGLVHHMTWKK
ncbi:MAG TPA: hypothetical protein VK970_25290 [Candidatus Methylacidiphilales bacterium]|nr:hypothetical protein [Candidatus Methylacidiphilales bacterium]